MDGFQVEWLRRLPLAQAVLRGFGYILDRTTLNEVFARHRRRCYQGVLRFDQLVYLIRDALTVHQGSGHRAFVAARNQGDLPVAEQNVCGKLARVPEESSRALLAVGAARLAPLRPRPGAGAEIPASLAGWRLSAFDGKKLRNAAKRLKALRGLPGQLLGGKVLVGLDVAAGLVLAMNADRDGERNDVPLVPGLVPPVRQQVAEPILWLGDRQSGNLEIPELLTLRSGDRFLLRGPKPFQLAADPQRPAQVRHDGDGRTVTCEWGWIGTKRDSRQRYVRRITLRRAQEEPVILITDLLDEVAVPAKDLLAAYRLRWDIERVFQL